MLAKNQSPPWSFPLLIVGAVCLAYLPAMRAGYVWDDADYVTLNGTLRSLSGLWDIWFRPGATTQYYPLVFSSFWLEWHVWGAEAMGYHVVNILLHAATAIAAWILLRELKVPGAWVAALIWALHPVQVQSVAWVVERKNVLSGVLGLLSVWAWVRWMDWKPISKVAAGNVFHRVSTKKKSKVTGAGENKAVEHALTQASSRHWYFRSLIAFALALLAKTAVCPLAVVMLVIAWWKKGRIEKREWMGALPFIAIAFVAGIYHTHIERGLMEKSSLGLHYSMLERMQIAAGSLWRYLLELVWPVGLTPVYPKWPVGAGVISAWIAVAGVVAAGVAIWQASRRWGRVIAAAALIYLAILLPALGLIQQSFLAIAFWTDHFQYLASLAPIALVSAAVAIAFERRAMLNPRAAHKPVNVLLVGLGLLTAAQCMEWHDLETLFSNNIRKNPASSVGYANVGKAALDRNDLDRAEEMLSRALELSPGEPTASYNMGVIWLKRGQPEKAESFFRQTLERMPKHVMALGNLGIALGEQKNLDEAIEVLEKAGRLEPRNADVQSNLGGMLEMGGRIDEAIKAYERALEIDPANEAARHNLEMVRKKQP